jgi:HAD superfamily hydrolase (TIGR01509 family)
MKSIIFDMDGVLVDSTPYHIDSWKIVLKRYGYDLPLEFREKIYGRRGRDIIREIDPAIKEEKIDEIMGFAEEKFREIYRDRVRPVDSVVEFVKHLKNKGYTLALATSASAENVRMILSALGLLSFFDPIVCEKNVRRGKPEPDIYLKVLELLEEKAENCMVFEDSFAGITSAKRANIEVIGVVSTNKRADLEKLGVRVIESFDDLMKEF